MRTSRRQAWTGGAAVALGAACLYAAYLLLRGGPGAVLLWEQVVLVALIAGGALGLAVWGVHRSYRRALHELSTQVAVLRENPSRLHLRHEGLRDLGPLYSQVEALCASPHHAGPPETPDRGHGHPPRADGRHDPLHRRGDPAALPLSFFRRHRPGAGRARAAPPDRGTFPGQRAPHPHQPRFGTAQGKLPR